MPSTGSSQDIDIEKQKNKNYRLECCNPINILAHILARFPVSIVFIYSVICITLLALALKKGFFMQSE